MAAGRSRPVRRAAQFATIGLVGLLLAWALMLRPAPLRQLVAEASGYAVGGSVYDPRTGRTIGGYEGSGPELRLEGLLRHDLAIAQKQGRRISRISRDGVVLWTCGMDRWVTGLEQAGGALLYSTTRHVGALDPADGHELWRRDPGTSVTGIGLAADRLLIVPAGSNVPLLEAGFQGTAAAGIGAPQPIEGASGLALARHAGAWEGDLVIADTFNHRVKMLRYPGGEPVWETEAFFPNQVQAQPDGSVLFVEEHANRIARFAPATGETEVLLSCDHRLFRSASSPDEIRARQAETARSPLLGLGARSVCDSRIDPGSLYSPNGFHAVDDSTIYVADTDNHRVAMFDADTGSLRGTVTGLNNPIRVIALPAGPVEEGN